MNVVGERCLALSGFGQDASIGPMQMMPPLVTEAIESKRKCSHEPPHPFDEIRARRRDRQMIVVGHQAPRMNHPPGTFAGFLHAPEKRRFRLIGAEYVAAIVAP